MKQMTIHQDSKGTVAIDGEPWVVEDKQRINRIPEKDFKNKVRAKKILDLFIKNYRNISIEVEGFTVAPVLVNHIFSLLMKNPLLANLSYPKKFFNEQQIKELKEHTLANKERWDSLERRTALKNSLFPFFAIAIAVVITQYQRLSLAVSLGAGALVGLASIFINYLGNKFTRSAIAHYNSPAKIDAVTKNSEKEALVAGVNAKSVTGYLWSFANIRAYQHPVAFEAGMRIEDEPTVNRIKNLKIPA